MLSPKAFTQVLLGLQQLRPMAKQLDEFALALAWQTFPEQAKRELTDLDIAWAAGQLVQDPNPVKDEAPHVALLRYLYRIGDGRPRLDWGLRFPDGTPTDHHFLPRSPSGWDLSGASQSHLLQHGTEAPAADVIRQLTGA